MKTPIRVHSLTLRFLRGRRSSTPIPLPSHSLALPAVCDTLGFHRFCSAF